MTDKFGFIYEEPKAEDYVFGAGDFAAPILQPNGQWDDYLPVEELQNKGTFEPYACASFGTDNAIEILLNKKYGFTDNLSDRYLAYQTGTQFQKGNSPHIVAEFIRKNGNCNESDWPFSDDIDTFEKYYSPTPVGLVAKARRLIEDYNFKHDYVPNDPKSMKDALKFSPLGMSVYGWELIDNGLYAPGNNRDNHWVVCYGYVEGSHWKIFDSYDNTKKNVAWSHRPLTVKRYHIELSPQTITWMQAAIKAIKEALAIFMSKPEPKSRVTDFALAIQRKEGGKPTDLNMRLNNPGACRYFAGGYLPKYGNVTEHLTGNEKPGQRGFAKFQAYTLGFMYLENSIKEKIRRHPNWNFYQFFGDPKEGWAPDADNNDSKIYAEDVAGWINLPPSTPIKALL